MRILFVGGDKRMEYAALKLSKRFGVSFYGEELSEVYQAVVLPLPLTKDSATVFSPNFENPLTFEELFDEINKYTDEHTTVFAGGGCYKLTELCEKLGLKLVNYFDDEPLTLQNAALTAEAAMCMLSQSGDGALLNSQTLILGSGRIAVFLAERLRACQSNVTIAARNAAKRERLRLNGFDTIPLEYIPNVIQTFDYVSNTIPAPLFDEKLFSKMKSGSVYQELATMPSEFKKTMTSSAPHCGVKYINAGGLPGKYFPKAAGEFIAADLKTQLDLKG